MALEQRPAAAQSGGRHETGRKLLEALAEDPLPPIAGDDRRVVSDAGERRVDRALGNPFHRRFAFEVLQPSAKAGDGASTRRRGGGLRPGQQEERGGALGLAKVHCAASLNWATLASLCGSRRRNPSGRSRSSHHLGGGKAALRQDIRGLAAARRTRPKTDTPMDCGKSLGRFSCFVTLRDESARSSA